MTNEEYRRSRGTHEPFTATPVESRKSWYAMNSDAIDVRRERERRYKRRFLFEFRTRPRRGEFDNED